MVLQSYQKVSVPKSALFRAQVRMIANYLSPLLIIHILSSFGLIFLFEGWRYLTVVAWMIAVLALVIPEIAQLLRIKGPEYFTELGLGFNYFRIVCLSIAWAALPLILLQFSGEGFMAAALFAQILVCGLTTLIMFAIPTMGLSFFVPVVLGQVILLAVGAFGPDTKAVALFLIPTMLFILSAGIVFSRYVIGKSLSQIEKCEKDNVISLLLTASNGKDISDWLLELGTDGRLLSVPQFLHDLEVVYESDNHKPLIYDVFNRLGIRSELISHLKNTLDSKKSIQGFDVSFTHREEMVHWGISAKPNMDAAGIFVGYIMFIDDKTEEHMAENERSRLALSDPLTGLMNRARFSEEIERATTKLERYGSSFALMFLDLDKFKLVNDMRGHMVGDKLLKAVSDRIIDVVRGSDAVARLGGDEFAILLQDECDAGSAAKLAARLLQAVGRKYEIDGEIHSIGVSIGIALAPLNGTQPNQLLRNADLALYRSKADGRGVFRFFESQMDADQREKRMLEMELREAIDDGQFELFYQPIVSARTGMAKAMEALIRWNHPIRGRISPDEFIAIAEQTSIIQEIGNWTIREACTQALDWPDDVKVSINLSAQHLIGSDIVVYTKAAIEETGFPAERLELEITESLFINNMEEAAQLLKSLKELGVSIVLDDFGTGYSSLSYLLKFPFDKIKIDRSFVMDSTDDEAAQAILKMISGLGDQLRIRITAEGVETYDQVRFLQSIKCDELQGYFFSRPLCLQDLAPFFLNQPENGGRIAIDKIPFDESEVA